MFVYASVVKLGDVSGFAENVGDFGLVYGPFSGANRLVNCPAGTRHWSQRGIQLARPV